MNRSRLLLVGLCLLTLGIVTSLASSTDRPAPSPAPPTVTASSEQAASDNATPDCISAATDARQPFCNKLCIIGYHCVPTPSGGVCVPDHSGFEPATVAPDDAKDPNAAADSDDDPVPALAPTTLACPPCTILCPVGTRLVQEGNCTCKCVGHPG